MKPDLLAAQLAPKLAALPQTWGARAFGIFDAMREYLDQMFHEVGLEATLAFGDSLWDTYGVPYDFELIPDVMEPSFDVVAKKIIRAGITSVHDFLHREPAPPAAPPAPVSPPIPVDESGASA